VMTVMVSLCQKREALLDETVDLQTKSTRFFDA
jgi:hypothetical protein